MGAFNHTLSAYEISFRHRRGYDADNKTVFPNIGSLVSMIASSYHNNEICKDAGYVLKLKSSGEKIILNNGVERIHITPDSGRRGRPTKMYSLEEDNREPYKFNSNWASTYQNNVFLYRFPNNKIYCIFHRVGNSGCKTIFMKLCNELLKPEGIIMDMLLIPPRSKRERNQTFEITKLKVIYREKTNSPDLADKLEKRKRKERVAKELCLDLRSSHNLGIKEIISGFKNRLCPKEKILERINPMLGDDYSEVFVKVSFGGSIRTIAWDDIENLFAGFDITDQLKKHRFQFFKKIGRMLRQLYI